MQKESHLPLRYVFFYTARLIKKRLGSSDPTINGVIGWII
jgi:hypothetical protein